MHICFFHLSLHSGLFSCPDTSESMDNPSKATVWKHSLRGARVNSVHVLCYYLP